MAAITSRPAKGRPREFDHDEVVERAMHIFWTKGFGGTSLPALLDATRLSRGSLYGAYGDKHGLFLMALDGYIGDSLKRVDDELSLARGALAGVGLFLDGYVSRNSGSAGRRGCLVVATAMEMSAGNPEVEKRIKHFFKALEARLTRSLERARIEGELNVAVEPAHAARALLGMVEGLRVIAKTGIDKRVWQATMRAQLALLERPER